MKYELRQMEQQGSGAIVNSASVGALKGNSSQLMSKQRKNRDTSQADPAQALTVAEGPY